MKTRLQEKLKKYSALSAVMLSGVSNNAEAEIIVQDFSYTGGFETYDIDIDGDMVVDFQIQATGSPGGIIYLANPNVGTNAIMGSNSGFFYPYNLSTGYTIDSSAPFISSASLGSLNYSSLFGNFIDAPSTGYLGVKFDISGQSHFGWIRLTVDDKTSWTIHESAYECIPNTEIIAGATENVDTEVDLTLTAVANTLTSNEDHVDATYRWLDCDNGNTPIPYETDKSFTPDVSGNYAVEISLGACVSVSDCASVNVVSVDENRALTFSIYPNPTKDQLNIHVENFDTSASIEITDALGSMVQKTSITNSITVIDVSGLPNGLYIANIKSSGGIIQNKFIKE